MGIFWKGETRLTGKFLILDTMRDETGIESAVYYGDEIKIIASYNRAFTTNHVATLTVGNDAKISHTLVQAGNEANTEMFFNQKGKLTHGEFNALTRSLGIGDMGIGAFVEATKDDARKLAPQAGSTWEGLFQ